MKTEVILLGHGSQAKCGNEALVEVAELVHKLGGIKAIPAYLQFCAPSLADAFNQAVADGAERIVVVPYFLYTGNHVTKDIPEELERLKAAHPDIAVEMTDHLGVHVKLAEIVLERIKGNKSPAFLIDESK